MAKHKIEGLGVGDSKSSEDDKYNQRLIKDEIITIYNMITELTRRIEKLEHKTLLQGKIG